MKKYIAKKIFGNGAALASALGITRAAVANWPHELDTRKSDEVIGAAIRLNKLTPEQARELIENERQRDERGSCVSN